MWVLPTPGLWNKAGTFLDKAWCFGFFFLRNRWAVTFIAALFLEL